MNDLQKTIKEAFDILEQLHIKMSDTEISAAARGKLNTAFQMAEHWEEVKEDG